MKILCTNDYKDWWKRYICLNYHSKKWVENDNREETIDALLEDREPDPSWYCVKCDKKYSKSIYQKKSDYYINDTGPR